MRIQLISLLLLCNAQIFSQITYDYYKNPEKIGSTNPKATEYFIKSFEFIMQWGSEDTDSAIYYMEKAIEEDSLYAIAYATLGHLIKYRGYDGTVIPEDSIARLADKALSINPECGDALTLQSWVHFMNGEYQEAINICKKAVEAEPDHRETWLWLGIRYSHLPEKMDSAVLYFNKTVELFPNYGQPHQKLGWHYLYTEKDYRKSAMHFREMIRLYEEYTPRDERTIVGYEGLGEALAAAGKFDDAIDTFNLMLVKANSSNLHWIDQLRSWTYRGLVDCYMGKAENEVDNFIALNLSTREQNPKDVGVTESFLQEIEDLDKIMISRDPNDTLTVIRESLYDVIFANDSADEYYLLRTLYKKYQFHQREKQYMQFQSDMESLLVTFDERKEIKLWVYFFMATNSMKLEDENNALNYIELAIQSGFNNAAYLKDNPVFESLHENKKFKKLVEQIN